MSEDVKMTLLGVAVGLFILLCFIVSYEAGYMEGKDRALQANQHDMARDREMES